MATNCPGYCPVTESRTDRKKRATRRRLIDAGRHVITEHGVGGMRIQALTERADVGLGLFYNNFSSKEELVEAIVSESLAELAAATIPAEWHFEDPAEVPERFCGSSESSNQISWYVACGVRPSSSVQR
jgi:AcrR family transcriptional regulator